MSRLSGSPPEIRSSDPLPGDFMTISQAAIVLQLSQQQVRRLIKQGYLPASRLGPRGTWRIPKSALASPSGSDPAPTLSALTPHSAKGS